MEKIRTASRDLIDANIKQIARLFPTVITEITGEDGSLETAIDFDLLRQELSNSVVDGPHERYQLDWPGKRASAFTANTPTTKTLRPMRDESVNFDATKNIFIEGDNLEALKILQESYLGKIKLIYIDPPYNTGNDFVYNDDFVEAREDYLERSGQQTGAGERLISNSESRGRFHSDWLSMMYPRLKLARNLLATDGIICASIDSHEVHNLRHLGDEVFGRDNFISEVVVAANPRGRQSDSYVAGVHDSLLIWARNREMAVVGGRPLDPEQKKEFSFVDDELGNYRLLGLRQRGSASRRQDRPEMYFPIFVSPDGNEVSIDPVAGWHEVLPRKSDGSDGRWMWGKDKCRRDKNRLVARWIERRSEFDLFVKDPLVKSGAERLRKFKSIWDAKGFNNQNGTQEVKALLGGDFMSFPKPVSLMKEIILLGAPNGGIILDFFAGSGTMAEAVLRANDEDGRDRSFVVVQLDEEVPVGSAADKAGMHTIAQLSRARIRAAGKNLSDLVGGNNDLGFRAFKIDTSNRTELLRSSNDLVQQSLIDSIDSIKPDRSDEDLLFEVLLDSGLDPALPISRDPDDNSILRVDDNEVIACFAREISMRQVNDIARLNPVLAVFRDSSFKSDADRINAEQIFNEVSPETTVRTI